MQAAEEVSRNRTRRLGQVAMVPLGAAGGTLIGELFRNARPHVRRLSGGIGGGLAGLGIAQLSENAAMRGP
jgi:hypothetical protein